MKVLYKAIVLLFALSTLVGCAGLNQAGTGRTVTDAPENTTGSSTAQVSSAMTTTTAPPTTINYDLPEFYSSDEYKELFPIRNDLVWYFSRNGNDKYPIGHYIYYLGISEYPTYYPKQMSYLLFYYDYDKLDPELKEYWKEHKFAVCVYFKLIGEGNFATEEDETARKAFLEAEEDYFESLGIEVIRNHTEYANEVGHMYIVIAITGEQLETWSKDGYEMEYYAYKAFPFETRLENEHYCLSIAYYDELGMYEEE